MENNKNSKNTKNFLLVDTNALIYRFGFALQDMSNSKQHPIGAIWGSLRLLTEINKKYNIFSTVFALDNPKNNRKIEYVKYKQHRKPTPDFIKYQFPVFHKIINYMQSYNFTYEGFEADDVIASLAAKIEHKEECYVYILTTDKDLLQLVKERCSVLLLGSAGVRCISTDQDVKNIVGVLPYQYADYLALVGDATDNIPGIKGIGEKAALYLLQNFSSLDNILNNISSIENLTIRKKVEDGQLDAVISKTLSLARVYDIEIDKSLFEIQNNHIIWSKNNELLQYLQNDLNIDLLLL